MSEHDGTTPGLSPEDEQSGRAAIERMLKRHREGKYRTNPPVPAKLQSMAPGMRVVKSASGPPVPLHDEDAEDIPPVEHDEPRPEVRAKMHSTAQGVHVTREAEKPPMPIPGFDPDAPESDD